MNKVILMGRLTKDPETKTAQSGVTITTFTLAVNRKFTKEGEEKQADFIFCKAFGKTAEFCNNYYKKGQQVTICGRIQTGSYDKDGQKVYTTDVIIEDAYFADSKKQDNGGATNTDNFEALQQEGNDELPF